MSELPQGWASARAEDVCDSVRDGTHDTPKYVDVGVPLVTSKNIRPSGIDFSTARNISPYDHAEISKRSKVDIGDVLFSMIGSVGHACLVDTPVDFSIKNVGLFKTNENKTLPKYVFYWLCSPNMLSWLETNLKGGNQKFISLGLLRDLPISVAPLNEQKRIADKLDTLLARVDACRERLDQVPLILKRFRQAVLAAATSGKLTEEWREERDRDMADWENSTVGQLIDRIEAGLNVQCEERPPDEGERGLVKISAVTWGTYDDNESKTLPPSRQVPEATRIRTGDFLISRANTLELVGACVIVHKVTRPVFLSDKVLRLVMPDNVKRWLLFFLQSENGRKQIEHLASGNQLSMRNLSQGNLRSIAVPVPQEDERKEIVRCVETLFAFADRLETRYNIARTQVERLTPALLAKAFRGELVPQDPNDEPASVLLERIREARKAQPGKPKGLHLGRRPTMDKITAESVKDTIRQLPDDTLSLLRICEAHNR